MFGSAGERDVEKRRMMGRIAGERRPAGRRDRRGSPRRGPDAILDEIARGAEDAGRRRDRDLLLIRDRPAAIAAAFERARPGDIVLLAGKGHEQSIIGPDGPIPYDERSTAEAALAAMGYRERRRRPGSAAEAERCAAACSSSSSPPRSSRRSPGSPRRRSSRP